MSSEMRRMAEGGAGQAEAAKGKRERESKRRAAEKKRVEEFKEKQAMEAQARAGVRSTTGWPTMSSESPWARVGAPWPGALMCHERTRAHRTAHGLRQSPGG